MLLDRLRLNVASFLIFTTEDGRVVFYPEGPFRGFVLPDSELESQLADSVNRHHTRAFWSCLMVVVIGAVLNFSVLTLALVGVFDYAWCIVRIRRMTRELVELPRGLSVRLYASLQPTEKLQERCVQGSILLVMAGAGVLLDPTSFILWAGFAFALTLLSVWIYVLRVHVHATSRAQQAASINRDGPSGRT